MSAKILDGKEIVKALKISLKSEVDSRAAIRKITLATILVGDSQDAIWYAKAIEKMMMQVGIGLRQVQLPGTAKLEDLSRQINVLSNDKEITGILLLSPLPAHLSYQDALKLIPWQKDAEGTRYEQASGLNVYPPTALAVLETIKASGIVIKGKHAVVVGRSRIVGRPAADLLLKENATVTICHSRTSDLSRFVIQGDIVVAATGRPNLIKGNWIKEGAVVSDAGENDVDGKPVGDVEFETAKNRASYITPVPGGVGPVTSLMLVKNLLELSKVESK